MLLAGVLTLSSLASGRDVQLTADDGANAEEPATTEPVLEAQAPLRVKPVGDGLGHHGVAGEQRAANETTDTASGDGNLDATAVTSAGGGKSDSTSAASTATARRTPTSAPKPSTSGGGRSATPAAQVPATTTTTGAPVTSAAAQRTTTTRQPTTTTRATTTTTRPATVNGPIVWVDSRAAAGGNGSQAAPFRTINQGILAVRAGETLMIKGGEYREHVNPGYRMPRGTSTARITMINAPGERVVVRGRLILTDLDYWTISGINVTWDNERNGSSVEHMIILNGGVGWEWRDSEIWGARAYSAILVTKNPRSFALRNLYVHDTYPTNDTNQDHLIYCACGTGGGVIERNLLVGSANGRAVKLGTASSSGEPIANVVVRYNTMVDNRGPSNILLSFNTSNITIERNIMVGTKDYAPNISTYQLNGSGSRAADNIGFESPTVVESHRAIIDGGGNLHRNPQLDANYVPQDRQSRAYGHTAP